METLTALRKSFLFALQVSTVLLHHANALALHSPPLPAKPVLVGTSDYSNILFGKLQRSAALWGTNLGEPTTIICPGDQERKLQKCLWNQFYMASPRSDGIMSFDDLTSPLSYYNNLKDTLIFFDAATPKEASGFSLPFMKKQQVDTVPTIDPTVLQCAVERGCAHIYVLASPDALDGCYQVLEPYNGQVASTIICLDDGVTMAPTKDWMTSRPQDLEGEFIGSVALRPYNPDVPSMFGASTIPTEDVAEVMIHIALRTDREFCEYPRFLLIGPSDDELDVRLNADYFTMVGGQKARELAGTVQSVTSWGQFLSPLGDVNTELGKRPDQP
uniref:Uncharacterized protein n=1 Tax=Trieres chinensis TaxID=1514140 RepID=A0A7S1ZDB2_TRICV